MEKLTDEEDIEYMNNKERIAAYDDMKKWEKEIKEIAKLPIQTILRTMPWALKKLELACENYNIVEAKIEYEIIQRRK